MKENWLFGWLFFFFLIISSGLSGQGRKDDAPFQEQIYLHINSYFFLTGESLLFKAYCIQAQNHSPSGLSSVAYIEVIDETGLPALRTKIWLKEGIGAGDIFLSSTLSTGHYTLIAYTRWMENFPSRFFFKTEITIINPFKKQLEGRAQKVTVPVKETTAMVKSFKGVEVSLANRTFKTREPVKMNLKMTNTPGKAHLSIGVRKLERQIVNANSPVGPIDMRNEVQRDEPPSMDYLPELRGNLITGTVLLKENNTPAVGRIIYLSVPTKEYLFYTSVTDSTGRFYFNSDELISSQYIVLKMEGCNDNCAMSLDDDFIKDHAEFVPSRLKIEPGLTLLIENQSVRSQIENAYYPLNSDSIAKGKNNRFYRNPDHVYYLDKYVRFPTMEDVLREYVAEVYVRKRDGTFTIKAMNGRTGVAFRENPLLLLDGVPVFDPNVIMNYDPLKVEKIDIVTHRYFYGPLEVSGVISFQTYEGDAQDLSFQDAVKQLYLGVQPYKIYYSPNYSVAREALARIPDYRIQLFWNPDIVIESNMTASIDFYTSDIAGEFEITIEGFLGNGEFVHQEEIIQVNNR